MAPYLGNIENKQHDHYEKIEETEVGGPVAPGEAQFPVQFVGKHPTELAEEEERLEVIDEPPLLITELVLHPEVSPAAGGCVPAPLHPRKIHQVAVPSGLQPLTPPFCHLESLWFTASPLTLVITSKLPIKSKWQYLFPPCQA